MNDKEAIAILTKLLEKYRLEENEREAVREAIGILAWTKLLEGTVKARKARRERDATE